MKRLAAIVAVCALSLAATETPQELMDKGHHKRLRSLAEPQFRDHPNDPESLWMMSFVKLSWGDHKKALDLAEKAVAADPKSPKYHLQLAQALGAEAEKASILRQPGLAKRFKKELETTLSLDPKNVEAMKLLLLYYFEAPGIMGGDKTKGHALPEQIGQANAAEGYLAQIRVAYYDKQRDQVGGLIRKSVEAGPSSYGARMGLATWLYNSKRFPEAEASSREVIRIDPARAGGHGVLVVALIEQNKWTELDAALAQAEKDCPDDFQPYLRAAVLCTQKSVELPRAERYLRKYLTQEPEPYEPSFARAHWRLGLALEKEGKKSEALAEWQTSVKLDPESPAKQELKRVK
jgi:tetratricopeptide (TPR) repeat protein